MKSYRYAHLKFSYFKGVYLYSTDSQVLDWTLAELKKVITNFRVSESVRDTLPSGEKCCFHIDELRDRDYEVGWWILKQLCLQGWEPFAVHEGTTYFNYHLRLEGNAK